jgi:hypothetical protein
LGSGARHRVSRKVFRGRRWPHAHIGGLQDANGSVRERWITVDTDTDDLDAGTARALARFLLAAADELEQMAFREAVAGLDIEEGITWHEAAKEAAAPRLGAGRGHSALVCADADTFRSQPMNAVERAEAAAWSGLTECRTDLLAAMVAALEAQVSLLVAGSPHAQAAEKLARKIADALECCEAVTFWLGGDTHEAQR